MTHHLESNESIEVSLDMWDCVSEEDGAQLFPSGAALWLVGIFRFQVESWSSFSPAWDREKQLGSRPIYPRTFFSFDGIYEGSWFHIRTGYQKTGTFSEELSFWKIQLCTGIYVSRSFCKGVNVNISKQKRQKHYTLVSTASFGAGAFRIFFQSIPLKKGCFLRAS